MKIWVYQTLANAGKPIVADPFGCRALTPDDGLELAAAALRHAKRLEPDLDLKHVRHASITTGIWRAAWEALTWSPAPSRCGDDLANHPFRK